MKSISIRDVFYGIVIISCVVLYSFLTRFEVISGKTNSVIRYDRITGKTYEYGIIMTWEVVREPESK